MGQILQEFLSENLHRNYPLLDEVSGNDEESSFKIPTELIADLELSVDTSFIGTGSFYISNMVVRQYTLDISISYIKEGDSPVPLGTFYGIPTDSEILYNQQLVTETQSGDYSLLEDSTGVIITGHKLGAICSPGVYSFSESATKLVSTVIKEDITKFRSLEYNGTRYTGNVILKEGEGVELNVEEDVESDTTTITINAVGGNSSDIVDDESLITAITNFLGRPITSINNNEPLDDGNFNIQGADCIATTTNEGTLTFDNPCSDPCCDKETYLPAAYEAINQVNVRHVKLDTILENIQENLTLLESRLKTLETTTGFF